MESREAPSGRPVARLLEALAPPPDVEAILEEVPELSLARGMGQGPYHHLDILDHILEAVRRVDVELAEGRVGARVDEAGRVGLRLVGLLHDVAKPVTRGVFEDRAVFVAHDALGARLSHTVCRRLGLSARITDLVVTLTALHLKIGFMGNERTDYPPGRLVRAAGPFGEELAVLCWADRLAAQGPRLKEEHIQRHRDLCREFLRASRASGPHPEMDYEGIARRLGLEDDADVGYAACRVRFLVARGVDEAAAVESVAGLPV